MLVVTSTFENKTAESLRAISENLIPVEPTVDAIKGGLARRGRGRSPTSTAASAARASSGAAAGKHPSTMQLIERIKSLVEAA